MVTSDVDIKIGCTGIEKSEDYEQLTLSLLFQ